MRLPQNVSGLPQFSEEVVCFEMCVGCVNYFLMMAEKKGVEEWKQVHLKCSSPLPAKGVLHKGAQLTNGVKFNEGNRLSYESH